MSDAARDQGWVDEPVRAHRESLNEALEERVDVHELVAEIKRRVEEARKERMARTKDEWIENSR